MPDNRTDVIGGIWAGGAPNVPATPVPAVTYVNSALLEATINAAWPYTILVDSSTFNEIMKRITTLLTSLEQNGILPWCATTTYQTGSIVLGSSGFQYKSLSNDNLNNDPTGDVVNWIVLLNHQFRWYTDTGIADSYILTRAVAGLQAPTSYFDGMLAAFFPTADNTGAAADVDVDGLGVKSIKIGSSDPAAKDMRTTRATMLRYNSGAGYFQIIDNPPLDEDNMASDSDVRTATQQSIKAYIENFRNLGAWDAGPPWLKATSYLAATDGFVCAFNTVSDNLLIQTDAADPPTIERTRNQTSTGNPGIMCPVRAGDYWEIISTSGTPTIFWIPFS